jgi:hypothetical protein
MDDDDTRTDYVLLIIFTLGLIGLVTMCCVAWLMTA